MSSVTQCSTGGVHRDVRTFKLVAVWGNNARRIARQHHGSSDSMNGLAMKQPQNASPVKHQELILDAIDQLRHRKARPDAERIYNSLFRRHSISCIEAKIALEKCVESGVVLRVAYKGNISYRNAAKKYSHLKRNAQGEIIRDPSKPRRKFNELLTNAFGDLVMQDPDYLQLGVPPNELIKTMLSKDPARYSKRYLGIVLDKEVETGGLIKMENGNFLVGPSKNDRCQLPVVGGGVVVESNNVGGGDGGGTSDTNALTATTHKFKKKTAVPTKPCFKDKFMESLRPSATSDDRRNDSLRVGNRRKRAKKVFDPSDNNLPKKRGRPNGSLSRSPEKANSTGRNSDSDSRPESRNSLNGRSDQGGVCSVCHFQIKKGPNDRMVSCRECSNKAHASCLNGDDMMLKMYLDNSWQCPHCKTCTVCYETSDAGYLAVCSICADAYHMGCHDPKLTERLKPGSKWLCANCQMPEQLVVDHIQIGYNMEAAMKVTNNHNDDTQSRSPELSRNTTPTSATSPPPSPTPPTLSPQNTSAINGRRTSMSESDKSDTQSIKEEEDENVDPSIPDARHWSTDDVYNYFFEYFPEEAPVFREQEIDGRSLLLMKRMDVLKGLCLKLGPALKIYRHVLKLQYRRDDPKLYWA